MPLPEGYLPREGDMLIVHVEVKHNVDPGETSVHVRVPDDYRNMILPLAKIAGLFARKWNDGDRVRAADEQDVEDGMIPEGTGIVLASNEEYVWIKFPTCHCTCEANELVSVQQGDPPPFDVTETNDSESPV